MSISTSRRVTFREVLFDTNGSRRTVAEAANLFGKRVVDLAEIAEALYLVRNEPRPLSTPKRVFISYRWGTRAANEWVKKLASKLTDRGCVVELDVMQQEQLPTIGSLVAKLVRCHVFLMVIDPAYIERVGAIENQALDRGWAYVEFRVSYFLPTPILRIGLLRAGDEIPRGMTLASETNVGDVIDAKTPEKLEIALDSFFEPWPEPPPEDIRRRCELLLDVSAKSALLGNQDESWRAAREAAELIPALVDADRSLVTAALRTNRLPEAVAAAERLLDKEFTRVTHLNLAALAKSATGDGAGTLDFITLAPFSADDWRRPLVIATALCAAGQRRAAEGHLQLAFTIAPLIKDFMNDWKKELKRCGRSLGKDWREFAHGEPLPVMEGDFPFAAPVITVLPFDGLQVREDGVFLVPVNVEVGDFPGLAMTREYDLTLLARTVLGAGDLLDEAIDGGEPGSHLACDSCGHVIPFLGGCHTLCEGCGAEYRFSTLSSGQPCSCCGENRMTLLEPAFDDAYARCPYCTSGRFRRIEKIGRARRKNLVSSKPAKTPKWRRAEVRFGNQPFMQARAREIDARIFAVFISRIPESVSSDLRSRRPLYPEIRIDGKKSRYLPSLKHQVQPDGVLILIGETF